MIRVSEAEDARAIEGTLAGEARMSRRQFAARLLLVALFALGLRVAVVWAMQDEAVTGDGWDYLLSAQLIANGEGYVSVLDPSQPIAHHPPGWVTVLAAAPLVGVDTQLGMQLWAAVLSAGAVVLVGMAAREIAGGRVGLIAAVAAAVYPGFWVYSTALLSETLAPAAVAATLLLAYRYRHSPTTGRLVALAVAVGLAMLTRAELALYFPLLVVPLVLSTPTRTLRDRGVHVALGAGICVLLVAPWTVYNLGRFDEPVLLSSGLGPAMSVGACDATYYGDDLGSHVLGCAAGTAMLHPDDDRSELDLRLRRAALDYAGDHLSRVPLVLLAREGRTWSLYRSGQQIWTDHAFSNAAIASLWAQLVAYWLLVIPAIAGAVLLRRRRTLLWPLLVPVLVVVLETAVTFGEPRHRAPAEVPLVILAAVAVDALSRHWKRDASAASALDPMVPDPPDRR